MANRAALGEIIARIAGAMTTSEFTQRLDQAQIAWARMNTMQDFVAHPQLSARGRWT